MKPSPKYTAAPAGWTYTDLNPFSQDGSYGQGWSAFCLTDQEDDQFITGQSGSGPFSARFGRRVAHLENRFADFLLYENAHGRTVILSLPNGMDVDAYVAGALSSASKSSTVRPYDPAVIVHSTTEEAWKHIQADNELIAASQLVNKRSVSPGSGRLNPIEEYLAHEPLEYRDYIMFGEMDSCVPEMVVASYQMGKFVLDENAVYIPGIRLYFDNRRIIRDGLGTRDGLHVMKVHLHLPLRPYLLAAVGTDAIDSGDHEKLWKLRDFVEKANEIFNRSRGG